MTNTHNFSVLKGRLVNDPKILDNKDGSRKVLITLAVRRNFKNKEGQFESDFINLQDFFSATAKTNGAYDHLEKGDLISVTAEDRSSVYTDAQGETVYSQYKQINSVQFEETKAQKDARIANKELSENVGFPEISE